MSQENVRFIEDGYQRFNAGGIDAILELLDPNVEWIDSALWPDREPRHGHQGVRAYFEQLLDVWVDFRCEPQEIRDMGENREGDNEIVAVCRLWGRGRVSGAEIEAPVSHHWVMRDGLALRTHFYWQHEEPEANRPA